MGRESHHSYPYRNSVNPDVTRALNRELVLLAEASDRWRIPTAHIAEQLIAWEAQPLPDALPPAPAWTTFQWPRSGMVSFTRERLEVDWSRE